MDSHTQLPVVGMVGGGQLARMTHQAAISLGQSLRVLAASADDGAAIVSADVQVGAHTDLEALRRFAKDCDVVTFDHEHVPGKALRVLEAEGVVVRPGPEALRYAQDKQEMRQHLSALGVPVPRWAPVDSVAALAEFGTPCVVKTATGGYDGKGVFYVDSPEDIRELLDAGAVLIAEERVELRRELAALVARSSSGEIAAYPVVETVQSNGICTEVIAPAPGLPDELAEQARDLAVRIAAELGVTGLLAVELFETGTGLLVNELAMRPHNSGHWTMEGSRTSQFEQHLRAVLDYPLGDTAATAPVAVMANVLGGAPGGSRLDERLQALLAEDPGARVHLYGKQVRPGRKIGHVNVLGDDVEAVLRRAKRAAAWLRHGDPEAGERQ
ncbi:MAG: 5-(carboxyamino)imidazole ribonucleotide synthase [Stackebrandtia sp.]